ncbi:MAG: ATP-binding protein [Lacunisphaera sp.]|nr:ATP-binding protein [Lacunisphaera sp.]
MATKKPKRVRPKSGGPKVPPVIRMLAGTLEGFGEAAVVTDERWQGGGVQIITVNSKFTQLTGYAKAELIGQNTRLLHGSRTNLLAPSDPVRRRHTAGEDWLYRKDGSEFYGAWSFSPVYYKGKPNGTLLGFYRDVSEGRRLREALKQSQKLGTVGLLASGVAHDFNNLLSVINGYCEIMAAKIADVPAAQKDLQEIHRAGLKAAAIARQILEFSRRQETEIKVINFNTLIREIAEILRRVAGDNINLELRLASDLGNARMDPTQFQQVLLNLCFNARDAMPQGGKLTIRTYNHQVAAAADRRAPGMVDGLHAVLRVSDTGLGMEPAVRDSIFEPFFTTKPHGTGLGLATVLGIIRQHDGQITVQSAPGQGTTFEIFLPETPEPEQTSVTKLGTLPAVRGTEELLIVEEDVVLRKMIAGILATDGYSVTAAATPAEASALVKETGLRPQLVLAQSCTKDGAALVRQLHAGRPGIRLICTSPALLAVNLHEVPRSATIHLPKPFALSTLLRGVRTLLDARAR